MKKLSQIVIVTALTGQFAPWAAADLSKGIENFEGHRWADAMGEFLEILRQEPGNVQAHAYVNLTARQMETERHARNREKRLELLGDASKRLDNNRMDPAKVQSALMASTHAEDQARQERWHSECEEAHIERDLGHLLAANDLILQVLKEEPGHPEAQRELSDLQSRLRQALDHTGNLSIQERYAYEGFYAFGQANYTDAWIAWQKVHAILDPGASPAQSAGQIAALHIAVYEKIAEAHMNEEKQAAALRSLFEEGISQYQAGRYNKALETFRDVAIQEPEFPQLGFYLVQTEAAAEKDLARRLGEEKRQEVERRLQSGIACLEQQKYKDSEREFERVLALDPGHPQAASYLAMAEAEMKRSHDPKTAQMHYEAGLIDYASGKLEDAVREWQLAARMDPQNEKAINALNKVQKELALNQEVP